MNKRLALLRQRRETLVQRAHAQRLEVAAIVNDWRRPLQFADTLLATARRLSRFWLLYAVALTFLLRARRLSLGVWIGRVWTAWEIYRSLRSQTRRSDAGGGALSRRDENGRAA